MTQSRIDLINETLTYCLFGAKYTSLHLHFSVRIKQSLKVNSLNIWRYLLVLRLHLKKKGSEMNGPSAFDGWWVPPKAASEVLRDCQRIARTELELSVLALVDWLNSAPACRRSDRRPWQDNGLVTSPILASNASRQTIPTVQLPTRSVDNPIHYRQQNRPTDWLTDGPFFHVFLSSQSRIFGKTGKIWT
jgi:hypothetical protein